MSEPRLVKALRSDYNEHSEWQRQTLDLALPYIQQGIDAHSASLPVAAGAFIIADFGARFGANTSAAMSAIIEHIRNRYGQDRTPSIMAVHQDLPLNNWGALFGFVESDPESYLKFHDGVFALATGRGFFQQVLPNNCLQIGFSNCSLHWLSSMPCKIQNHLLPNRGTPEERELCRQQSARDWEKFVSARAAELVPGGVLVAHVMADGEQTVNQLYDAVYRSVLRLRDESVITEREVVDFNVNLYQRSVEDVRTMELYDRLGLELIVAERMPMPEEGTGKSTVNAYYQAYLQHGNVQQLAWKLALVYNALLQPLFLDSLSSLRGAEKKKVIGDKFLQRLTDEIGKIEPDKLSQPIGSIYVVLKKKNL